MKPTLAFGNVCLCPTATLRLVIPRFYRDSLVRENRRQKKQHGTRRRNQNPSWVYLGNSRNSMTLSVPALGISSERSTKNFGDCRLQRPCLEGASMAYRQSFAAAGRMYPGAGDTIHIGCIGPLPCTQQPVRAH
jgi:hypothetical protein